MIARFLTEPVHVRAEEATRSTWGDEQSGRVFDRFYGEGPRISGVLYTMTPGSWFGASPSYMPVPLEREERCQFVVAGTFALHDPESGHVAVASAGEAVTWRGDQFHFGYNVGPDEAVLLDFFTPQGRPEQTADADWAARKRPLARTVGGRYDLLTRWPAERAVWEAERRAGAPMTVRVPDALPVIEGTDPPRLVSILSSTPGLTVGTFALHGTATDAEAHPGDEVVYPVDGELTVELPDLGRSFALAPLDCLFIPAGTRHAYSSATPRGSVRAVFGVAPRYR